MGKNSGVPYEEIFKEQWRDIAGWNGYQVSDLGRVRHWDGDSGAWWMIRQNCVKRKKQYVVMSINGKHFTVMVDRLVMETFVGAREGRRIIHVNHTIEDNALDNLQYANRDEYRQWMREHWRVLGRTKDAERRDAVVQRREQRKQSHNEAARKWLSGEMPLKEAAASIGVTESALSYWIKRHDLKSSR